VRRSLGFLVPLVLIALTAFGLFWANDLKQINKETIFLTSKSRSEYSSFRQQFNLRSLVVVKIPLNLRDDIIPLIKETCREVCQIVDHTMLPQKADLFRLKSDAYEAILLVQSEGASEEKFKRALSALVKVKALGKVSFTGVPYTNILLDKYSEKVKTHIFPSLFVGVFLLLFVFLRSLKFSIIVFFPGLMAAASSLAFTKGFFGHSNLITSIIPLLLFVIQMSMVLHIHSTARELLSLKEALKEKLEPVLLMVVTTFIGFGSLFFSDLKAISDFGLLTAILLLLTTILSYIWLFSLSLLRGKWWSEGLERNGENQQSDYLKKLLVAFWSGKKILIFSLISLSLGSFFLTRIKVITDATEYFPQETGLRDEMIAIAKDFVGTPLVEIVLEYKGDSYDELLLIDKGEQELQRKLGKSLLSANSLVRVANLQYTGMNELPSNKFAYHALRSQVPEAFRDGYSLEEGYRLTILGEPMNIDSYELLLKNVKNTFGDKVSLKMNGLYYHLMMAQNKMIGTLFKSFFFSLFLISTLAFLYFKSIKLFFLFMFVNIIPVFASFPLLYLFDLSFNIATVMTYSISLGLIVDSSFHIIHALNNPKVTRDYFIKSVLVPIVGASLLLSICFFFFAFSDFLPIREFGLSLAIVIILGMLLDLKVLPALYKGKLK